MRLSPVATLLLGLAIPAAAARAEESKPAQAEPPKPAEAAKPGVVATGRQVSIEYTLTLDDGTKADTNVGGEPLVFEQGAHEILPALEDAIDGMKVNESRRITLPPEKGYGAVNPQLVQEVDASLVPEDGRFAGAQLSAQDEKGNQHYAVVREVREDKVLVDLNHPLAGKTLLFELKVLAID